MRDARLPVQRAKRTLTAPSCSVLATCGALMLRGKKACHDGLGTASCARTFIGLADSEQLGDI